MRLVEIGLRPRLEIARMTNRDMVKPPAPGQEQKPNAAPLPPMPAPEDSRTPTTAEEPIDSPQPNADHERAPPAKGEFGLTTKR